MSKVGIKELTDWIDFVDKVLTDLEKHKEDDGVISNFEKIQTAINSAPSGIQAVIGSDQLISELMDIDSDEAIVLSKRLVNTINNIIKLFKK